MRNGLQQGKSVFRFDWWVSVMSRIKVKVESDWQDLGKPKGNIKGNTYLHKPSGWKVSHCGGFSAIYPWYLTDPAFPNHLTMTPSGRGFPHLKGPYGAMTVVEGIVSGKYGTSNENCDATTRVVVFDPKPNPPDFTFMVKHGRE